MIYSACLVREHAMPTSDIDMSQFVPHYRRIMIDIIGKISNGELCPGEQLPSTPALADQYGVSVGTVRSAIVRLVEARWLRSHQGLGVYVADVAPTTNTGE